MLLLSFGYILFEINFDTGKARKVKILLDWINFFQSTSLYWRENVCESVWKRISLKLPLPKPLWSAASYVTDQYLHVFWYKI